LPELFFIPLLFAAERFADDSFADFFTAGPRLADVDFLLERFVADALLERFFDALPFDAALPLDFLRDFLARVAMILLLGVGGEQLTGG